MRKIKDVKDICVCEGKIVRDRIPEIIEKEGRVAYVRVLQGDALKLNLKRKLLEEANEAFEAKNRSELVEELVDVIEVVDAIADAYGITRGELGDTRAEKNEEKGEFTEGYYLIESFSVLEEV